MEIVPYLNILPINPLDTDTVFTLLSGVSSVFVCISPTFP